VNSFCRSLSLHPSQPNSVNRTQCFARSHDDPVHGAAQQTVLQEHDRSPLLRAVGRGAVGDTMHGEDVAVFCGHCVGLRRVAVLNYRRRLQQKDLEDNALPV
jgi:hypothetical protein